MTVQPGTRLGPYEIVAPLGSGGMGEVYRANDTRLNRTVAIKIVSPLLADSAELRQRFEREAHAASSLNHPHICALFDVGQQNGLEYLVMEYLDGETLAARLTKGPLSIDHVLQYANEIVSALDAAHRQGITHRDLKPANIMLTRTGAKLLDFGLAKWNTPRTVSSTTGMAAMPTQRAPLTTHGTLLGTFNYMAPEQLEGKEADARSDLFAFGAVVYEMATGRRAFDGATQASVIAAILEREPEPLSQFQPLAPVTLERIVQRCLHKDPEDRWQTARDLSAELGWLSDGSGIASAQGGTLLRRMQHRTPLWQGAALLFLGCAAAAVGWSLALQRSAEVRSIVQAAILLTAPLDVGLRESTIALSPDGTRVIYRSPGSGPLHLRTLDQRDGAPIAGTDGGVNPCFSPDGQWVAFFVGNYLKKVSLAGGAGVTLAEFPTALENKGATWGGDDTIIFAPLNFGGLLSISGHGGRTQTVSTLDLAKGEVNHRWPEWLPGGKAVIFTVKTTDLVSFDDAQIVARSLVTGEQHVLLQGAYARYVPTGYLVYARRGSLQAVPFDVRRLEVTGPPVIVLDGVVTHPASGAAQFAISGSGTLVYGPGDSHTADRALVWVNRRGIASPFLDRKAQFTEPRISPDGRRLAVGMGGAFDRLWVSEIARGTLTRLTTLGGNHGDPAWMPDSARITFAAGKPQEELYDLYSETADGGGAPERLVKIDAPSSGMAPTSWSPDGRTLLYQRKDPKTGWDLWIVSMEATPRVRPFLQTPFDELGATFSPNGQWLAYASNESGRLEVYVRPFPGPGGKSQISTEGGASPVWAASGRELFFSNGDKLMTVAVGTEGKFEAGKAGLLFSGRYDFGTDYRNYDVTSDGQRFVVIENGPDSAPTHLNLTLNWADELKRLVRPKP